MRFQNQRLIVQLVVMFSGSETVVPMCISSEDRQNHPPGKEKSGHLITIQRYINIKMWGWSWLFRYRSCFLRVKFYMSDLMAVHTTTNVFPALHNLKIGGTKFLILYYRVLEEKPINTYEKFYSFFSYNHLQITLVMSGFKSCKNLARWFKTCKILARILQDINQGQKINLGTSVLGNIFEASFCLLNKLRSLIQWKKNSQDSKSCKNLARILQDFEFRKKYLCVFGS